MSVDVCIVVSWVAANVFGLGEGGDFQHQLSYEAVKFIQPQNCPTKHCTATCAKPVLPAYPSVFRVKLRCLFELRCGLLRCLSVMGCAVAYFYFLKGGKFFKNNFFLGGRKHTLFAALVCELALRAAKCVCFCVVVLLPIINLLSVLLYSSFSRTNLLKFSP